MQFHNKENPQKLNILLENIKDIMFAFLNDRFGLHFPQAMKHYQ